MIEDLRAGVGEIPHAHDRCREGAVGHEGEFFQCLLEKSLKETKEMLYLAAKSGNPEVSYSGSGMICDHTGGSLQQ